MEGHLVNELIYCLPQIDAVDAARFQHARAENGRAQLAHRVDLGADVQSSRHHAVRSQVDELACFQDHAIGLAVTSEVPGSDNAFNRGLAKLRIGKFDRLTRDIGKRFKLEDLKT